MLFADLVRFSVLQTKLEFADRENPGRTVQANVDGSSRILDFVQNGWNSKRDMWSLKRSDFGADR